MDGKTLLALTFIRNIVFALPGVVEQLCFDTPAFYVNGKIFARLHEDEAHLVIHTIEREKWMRKDPAIFFITPHYVKYKYMLVNLDGVEPTDLRNLLIEAWRVRAPKKLIDKLNS